MSLWSQIAPENTQYEPSKKHPHGQPNPATPEVLDYTEMIGTCDCQSVSRNSDRSWADTTMMIWKFKYIMNGTAVQDEVWREEGKYAGSIRQFQKDSAKWIVTYYSNPKIPYVPPVWHGMRNDNEIVLYKPQKSPNGMEGSYRITFYDLSDVGFSWKGEWVNLDETIVYPTWMIFCKKRE